MNTFVTLAGTVFFGLLTCSRAFGQTAPEREIQRYNIDYGYGRTIADLDPCTAAYVQDHPAVAFVAEFEGNIWYSRNSSPDGSGDWQMRPVVTHGITKQRKVSSLLVVDGHPALVYVGHDGVYYVRALDAVGDSWGRPLRIDTRSSSNRTRLSMKVVAGHPAVAFSPIGPMGEPGGLQYIRALDPRGDTWGQPVSVESSGTSGGTAEMAVVDGHPAIAHFNTTSKALLYNRALDPEGTNWAPASTVQANCYLTDMKMQVIANRPCLLFVAPATGLSRTRFLRASDDRGDAWGTPHVFSNLTTSASTDLGVVAGKVVVVAGTSGRLDYYLSSDAEGTTWNAPFLDQAAGHGGGDKPVLLTHATRGPILFHNSFLQGVLCSASQPLTGDRPSWLATKQIDGRSYSGETGQYPSQCLVNGFPAVSYHDQQHGDLIYIRASQPDASAWGKPLLVDASGSAKVGVHPSLDMVGGRPAIAYHDQTNKNLKYVRALDADGLAWGSPVVVSSRPGGNVGQFPSLHMVAGRPAISYSDKGNGDLVYIRSEDEVGAVWGNPVVVDDGGAGEAGACTSLEVVAGHPAIAYKGYPGVSTRYVRALDETGSSWGAWVPSDAAGIDRNYLIPSLTSSGAVELKVLQGTPVILRSGSRLWCSRALDPRGDAWSTAVAVSPPGLAGIHTLAFASIQGHPAVCYSNTDEKRFYYTRARDPLGINWPAPQILEQAYYFPPGYVSLLEVAGHPGMATYNHSPADLIYFRYVDRQTNLALERPEFTSLPLPSPSLDLGLVTLGERQTATIYLRNAGMADLVVHAADLEPSPHFQLEAPLAGITIPVGGRQALSMVYAPACDGPHQAVLTIRTSDPDDGAQVLLRLSGEALSFPAVAAQPAVFDQAGVTLTARMSSVGSCNLLEHGFVLLAQAGDIPPLIGGSGVAKRIVTPPGTNDFSLAWSTLEHGQLYHFRAYVITEHGTTYSDTRWFRMLTPDQTMATALHVSTRAEGEFPVTAGRSYRVERCLDLSNSAWVAVWETTSLIGGVEHWVDPHPPEGPAAFYRVILVEP